MKKTIYITVCFALIINAFDLKAQDDASSPCRYIKKERDYTKITFTNKNISKGWEKIDAFSDEFNGDDIDALKWQKLNRICHPGSPFAVVDSSMVNVQDGHLILSMEEATDSIECGNWEGIKFYHYTTGRINSKEKIRYGYLEIKCTFPNNYAMRPCFWLHGGRWSSTECLESEEIDVVERPPSYDGKDTIPNLLLQNFYHNIAAVPSAVRSSLSYDINLKDSHLGVENTYAVEWLPEEIHFYFNGNITSSMRYTDEEYDLSILKNSDFTCTDFTYALPQIIDISYALGQRFGMCESCQDISEPFLVEYVRSYKLQKGFDYQYWPQSFSMSDQNMFKVHKSVKLGGDTSHTAVVPLGQNITIWAEEGIVLDKGFQVSAGSSFAARVIKTDDELFINTSSFREEDSEIPPVN